jgi:molybdopterin-synthase adenylyltransferase
LIAGLSIYNCRSLQVKDYAEPAEIPCLHAGLSADYAEIIWNQVYRVPTHVNDDICDYPLARNLVMLTVAVACEAIVSFIATGDRHNFTITLKDLTIRSLRL